jgi:hypothetical protein
MDKSTMNYRLSCELPGCLTNNEGQNYPQVMEADPDRDYTYEMRRTLKSALSILSIGPLSAISAILYEKPTAYATIGIL